MTEDESQPDHQEQGQEQDGRKARASQRGSNLVDADRRRGGKKSAQSQERSPRGRFAGTKERKEQGGGVDGDQGISL